MGLVFSEYSKKCKSTVGGVKKLYILPYVEYTRSQVTDYRLALTAFPASYIYHFDCEGSYNQQSSNEEGATSFEQSVNVQLSEVYNVIDVNKFLATDFRVIVETNNEDLLMFGAYNGMECSLSNASGTNKNEFNGFNLDFKGKELKAGLTITSLASLGFIIFDDSKVFDYDFNFNI